MLVANSAYCLCCLHLYLSLLDLAPAGIDVLIIGSGLHLSVVRPPTGHNLRDPLLFFVIEIQFDQKFRDHSVESIQDDVTVSQLTFGVQGVPDVANCAVVLDDST